MCSLQRNDGPAITRARGVELKRVPDDVPVFAVAHAGAGRWRWAVWTSRADFAFRDPWAPTLRDALRVREPFAGGYAYSEAEAIALVRVESADAVRIARAYATPLYLHHAYARRDQLLAEANAAGEPPETYAEQEEQALLATLRAEGRRAFESARATLPATLLDDRSDVARSPRGSLESASRRPPFWVDMRSGQAHPDWHDLPANEWSYASPIIEAAIEISRIERFAGPTAALRHAQRMLGAIITGLMGGDEEVLAAMEQASAVAEDGVRRNRAVERRRRRLGPDVVDLVDELRARDRRRP